MFLLEHLYPNPLKPMFPSFSRLRLRALELLELHRALMNAWSCSLDGWGLVGLFSCQQAETAVRGERFFEEAPTRPQAGAAPLKKR